MERFRNSGRVKADGPVRLVEATDVVGESTNRGVQEARAWLVSHDPAPAGSEERPNGVREPVVRPGAAERLVRAPEASDPPGRGSRPGPVAGHDDEQPLQAGT